METGSQHDTILIIDDDPAIITSLKLMLKQAGFASQSAQAPTEALALLQTQSFRLVIQDLNFSRNTTGEEGLALLEQIHTQAPELPVILITAWGSIALAVEGMKRGASDFVTKPWKNEALLQSIRTALNLAQTKQSASRSVPIERSELDRRYDFRMMIGAEPNFLQILDWIGRVAATNASVLITGESGTGKELVAEALHVNSPRRHQPLIKVNLGGIPTSLFESELFGHKKGAFTDAKQDRIGRFEAAQGGTLFLDEIGDLDWSCQVKLLRVLQERTFEKVGSSVSQAMDVRVVTATNRDLPAMIQEGTFREDLFYRLNLIHLSLPPLRERRGDIPALAEYFLQQACAFYKRPSLTFTPEALQWLRTLRLPGNVRELKQLIDRTALLSTGPHITPYDCEITTRMQPSSSEPPLALPEVGSMTLDEMEKAMIERALHFHSHNLSKVAESLGLSRAALYRRLNKYGIDS